MSTLADVAAHAHVGIGTVSRVLNGSPNVSDSMRIRVRQSMEQVGYAPSRKKASEQLRRPGFVGVLVTFFDEPSAYERLRGILPAAQIYVCTGQSFRDKILANIPKTKGGKGKGGKSNGHVEASSTFHVPRSMDIQLHTTRITQNDVVHLRYFTEYQWLVDFSLYTTIVYCISEVCLFFA